MIVVVTRAGLFEDAAAALVSELNTLWWVHFDSLTVDIFIPVYHLVTIFGEGVVGEDHLYWHHGPPPSAAMVRSILPKSFSVHLGVFEFFLEYLFSVVW